MENVTIGLLSVVFFWTAISELLKEELQFKLKNTYLIIGCFIYLSYFYGSAFALRVSLFLTVMLFITVYDSITKTIPRFTHWLLIGVGLIDVDQNWLLFQAVPGFLIPAIPILIFNFLLIKKIGLGDIKLMASAGFVVGITAGYVAILFACSLAWILKRNSDQNAAFAFGPFLCLSYLLIPLIITSF